MGVVLSPVGPPWLVALGGFLQHVAVMRRIAIARLVGLVVAVVCIGLSVHYGLAAKRHNAEFDEWLDARPMECAVDLSKPGETTAPFHQTCGVSHGESLFLECDPENAPRVKRDELLKGLSARLVIKDSEGKEVKNVAMESERMKAWNDGVTFMLADFEPFHTGDYVATIHVDSGAPALAGKRQTVYAGYLMCGVEQMPAYLCTWTAWGAGMIGLVSAAFVLPGLFRSGIWRASVVRRSGS